MRMYLSFGMFSLFLTGCSTIDYVANRIGVGGDTVATTSTATVPAQPSSAPVTAPETAAPPPPANAQTAAVLDTTTAAQRAAASAPPEKPNRALGTTIATLGSAAEPGLWLKTPLVSQEQQGRVTNPANGKSSAVTLIPIDGPKTGGSRMSLAALRLIGASLTDLTEVEVSLES